MLHVHALIMILYKFNTLATFIGLDYARHNLWFIGKFCHPHTSRRVYMRSVIWTYCIDRTTPIATVRKRSLHSDIALTVFRSTIDIENKTLIIVW
jgi:hypothetical protein